MAEHIPEDVMINVLERLPVKSLMRFICVSKRWRFIISDPQFAKSHYKLSCENQTIRRKFFLSNSNRFALDSLDFESPSPLLREVRIPFEQPGIKYWYLRCSCNGLLRPCLCAFVMFGGSIDFWVMREYGVADSRAKLFKFNVSIPSENIYESERLVVSDTSITLERERM
ncbi:hypothetical protein ACLB2K_065933 [Fragaria x ananassa]